MTTTTHPAIARARRDIDNLRGFIRRPGLTGWVKERSANAQYERAFTSIARAEDELGVDAVAPLAERLLELRWEAERAHLLDRAEIGELERRAIVEADYHLERDVDCPVCDGPGVELGTLGRREHYRCRDCGLDFSTQA